MLDTEDSDGFEDLGGPTLVDLLERQEEINRALLDIQKAMEQRSRWLTPLLLLLTVGTWGTLTAIGLSLLSRS
jgi:hypothetical protein